MKKLLVKNIGMLATPQGKNARSGAEQGEIQILKDAWVLIEDGLISQVGTGAAPEAAGAEVVDAKGRLVTPGLVDAHTHLIFGGWRQNELGMKLHGKTYLEIQNAGGGIQSTTNATRQATEEELALGAELLRIMSVNPGSERAPPHGHCGDLYGRAPGARGVQGEPCGVHPPGVRGNDAGGEGAGHRAVL